MNLIRTQSKNSFYYTLDGELVAVADVRPVTYIEVLPEYRRRGIATHILNDLKIKGIAGSAEGDAFLMAVNNG